MDRALHNLHTFGGRIDVGLYLLNIGCGNEDDKAKLLFGACQWGRLDVVKELVEKHKLDPSGMLNAATLVCNFIAAFLSSFS